MLDAIFRRRRNPAIATADALGAFLDKNALLIAQKSVIGYCQVKTMLPMHELMKDKPFVDAYEISRWEAFAAVLADLTVVAAQYLRSDAGNRLAALSAALVALYGRLLEAHPRPGHRADGWQDVVEELRMRFAASQETVPQPIGEIARISAARLFATMPIHERLREADQPAIEANVQFMMVGLAHEFEAQFNRSAIVADLLAAPVA